MRALLALLLLTPLATLTAAEAPAKKPNVIIILADDLGYDDVGCYWTPDKRPGFEKIQTPNIDRLAVEGVRFTDFYAPSSVRTPSRAALMTGCYPVRVSMSSFGPKGADVLSNAHAEGLNPDELTLAEILKGRGYATGCVGKWHLGHLPSFSPRQHGFDSFYGMMFPNDMGPFVLHRDETVVEPKPDQKTLNERFTEEAVKFVQAKREEPFFLYLSHKAVHANFTPEDKYEDSLKDLPFQRVASEQETARDPLKPRWLRDQRNSWHGVDFPYHSELDIERYYKRYCETLRSVDDSIGRVLQQLKDMGIHDETLVIYMGDNGFMFGEHGLIDKRVAYETSMRVPMLAQCPAVIKPGTVLFEIAGVPEDLAKQALARIAYKMPVRCRFVGRRIAV